MIKKAPFLECQLSSSISDAHHSSKHRTRTHRRRAKKRRAPSGARQRHVPTAQEERDKENREKRDGYAESTFKHSASHFLITVNTIMLIVYKLKVLTSSCPNTLLHWAALVLIEATPPVFCRYLFRLFSFFSTYFSFCFCARTPPQAFADVCSLSSIHSLAHTQQVQQVLTSSSSPLFSLFSLPLLHLFTDCNCTH